MMLNELKAKITPIEFNRFLRAASETPSLCHIPIPAPYCPTTGTGISSPTSIKSEMIISSPTSAIEKEEEEERKLREKLEEIKTREKEKEKEINNTVTRIEKLRKEVEEAESTADKLIKNNERKSEIDSKLPFSLIL
jgi:septal ring factor EnvC (AmiA/AmiB activator)